jgi:hypothetical protein
MKLMSARWSILVLLVVGLAATTSTVIGSEGRWKQADDGSCYWDSTDSGPDQCDGPGPTVGRWKLAPDGTCVWDAEDSGPDQCADTEAEQATDSLDDGRESLPSSTGRIAPDRSVEVLASPIPDSTSLH